MKVMKLALGKAKAKAKASTAKALGKARLNKSISRTLREKIDAAAEGAEDQEEAAQILKDSVTKEEHSKACGANTRHI